MVSANANTNRCRACWLEVNITVEHDPVDNISWNPSGEGDYRGNSHWELAENNASESSVKLSSAEISFVARDLSG